jgi:hypothetical protein
MRLPSQGFHLTSGPTMGAGARRAFITSGQVQSLGSTPQALSRVMRATCTACFPEIGRRRPRRSRVAWNRIDHGAPQEGGD